jgi:benzoyl-CoA reductase subunit A
MPEQAENHVATDSGAEQAPRAFWRWSEKVWRATDVDWRKADAVAVGIDVGSVSSQAVILANGKLLAFCSTRTGSSSPDSALRAFRRAAEPVELTLDDVDYAVGTGYGRVNVPFAQRTITEIACHARGANFMAGPRVRTILDMGGQDCKVIRCDERGKVLNFIMNDKCAAGTGRGMEVIADVLSVPIEDIGWRSFDIDKEPPPVSNVCTVFAKSEATSLLRAGWSVNLVLAAYCGAMAQRVSGLIERMDVEPDFFITGGIAKNAGVTRRIERLIGVEAVKLPADSVLDPQIAGALGAALFAHSLFKKAQKEAAGEAGPASGRASQAAVDRAGDGGPGGCDGAVGGG